MQKRRKKIKSKGTVVVVSGGFDPLHIGHIRLMQEAKKLGDKLVVVLNNDNWLKSKKGSEFMPEQDRKEIIEALECVDEVFISKHSSDMDYNNPYHKSVCEELKIIRPHIFANGGDRFADDIPEFKLCQELGIKTVFNLGHGGKVRSSSDLLKDYSQKLSGHVNKIKSKKTNKDKRPSKKK